MNTKYTLKNFRVFDKEGSTFELAPITILTGPNGSGKSSVSKSLQMLKNVHWLADNIVDLSKGEHELGRFDKITNWESEKNEITVEFSYQSYLLPLHSNLKVKIVFRNEDKQKPYEATIVLLEIFAENGELLFHCDRPNSKHSAAVGARMDYSYIKDDIIQRVKEWQTLYNSAKSIKFESQYSTVYKIGGYDKVLPILIEYAKSARKINAIDKNLLSQCVPPSIKTFEESEVQTEVADSNLIALNNFIKNVDKCTKLPAFVETGIIYNLDIIKTLDALKKEEIYQFLYERINSMLTIEGYQLSDYRDTLLQDLQEMVDDYILSPFSSFSQYYKHLEDSYLENGRADYFETLHLDWIRSRYIFTFAEFIEAYRANNVRESLKSAFNGAPHDEWERVQKDEHWDSIKSELKKVGLSDRLSYGGILNHISEDSLRDSYNASYAQQKAPTTKFILVNNLLLNWWYPSLGKDEKQIEADLKYIESYYESILQEIFTCSDFLSNTEYISGIRANAKRLYTFDDNGSLSKVLFQYLRLDDGKQIVEHGVVRDYDGRSSFLEEFDGSVIDINTKKDYNYLKGTFLKQSLKMLLDIDDVKFESDPESVGIYIKVLKTVNGKQREILLADMGYGNTPLLSMLLQIEIAIKTSLNRNKEIKHTSAFEDMLEDCNDDYLTRTTICIEEPETNLHPAVQSRLADVFKMATEEYPVNFILETHSEYLIRRSQVLVAEAKYKDEQELADKCPFKVYYLPEAGTGKPYDMEYQTNGKFAKRFGKGFCDVAGNLMLDLL